MKAVIMAGGKGSRLRPYTNSIPKPLLPIGRHPVLEIIILRLQRFGYDDITLAVGYMADMVMAYFRDGRQFGVRIRYFREATPLGTAGALSALHEHLDQTFLLMNCDIVTRLDFSTLLDFHRQSKAELTIATKRYEVQVPYGVVEMDGHHRVQCINEKPGLSYQIVAGIYMVEPSVLNVVPHAQYCDMPTVVSDLLQADRLVASYLFDDYWLDVGHVDDLERAAAEIGAWEEEEFLPSEE